MTTSNPPTAEKLYAIMGPGLESSGGSAGNTVAGIAALGGRAASASPARIGALVLDDAKETE